MQAIILATGDAQKLRPITDQIPSPLIPITNQPVMQYAVELLARAGIKEIIVSLHHLSGSIEAYFGEGRRWGVNFQYVLQRHSMGDAGSLRWAKHLIHGPILVLPADEIIDLDIESLIAHHEHHRPLMTVVTHPRGPLNKQIHFNDRLQRDEYFTGIFICEPALLEKIPPREHHTLREDLLPGLLANGGEISFFEHHGYWNTLATFDDFSLATKAFFNSASRDPAIPLGENNALRVRFPSIPAHYIGNNVWVGRSNSIHPTVKIIPPIAIGDNCQIGREVELGPYTVIGSNVVIDDEATISESTINNYTYVGQLVQINNRFVDKQVMVDLESSESTQIVDQFLLSEATPSLVNSGVRRFLDIVSAAILIAFLFPVFLILGLISLLTTGKIIQVENRYGIPPSALATGTYKTPREIRLHRFSTLNRRGEPTRWGQFAIRWSLNRLPELFDVLAGRIGFVGVKPLRPDQLAAIEEEWQKKRFEYNVGLIGLWFSELDRHASLDEILITDVYYVATRSWRTDFKLMLLSPIHLWRRAKK